MFVEAYRYSVLAAAAENVDQEQPASANAPGKKVQTDWSTNIGEPARHIEITRGGGPGAGSSSSEEVLVVGEHTLFWLKEKGTIRMLRRMEHQITCATCYPVPEQQGGAG